MPSCVSKTRPQPAQRSGSPASAPRQSGQASATSAAGWRRPALGHRVARPYTQAVPHTHSRAQQNGRAAALPRRKVVLVLEDHASVGGLIAALLRQEGYRAVRAWDPQEALRLARGRPPDLVLLDINLAYPDGLDVLKQVRGHEATRRAPIVVVAGGELALSTDDALLVDGVVQKPFDIDIMLERRPQGARRSARGGPTPAVRRAGLFPPRLLRGAKAGVTVGPLFRALAIEFGRDAEGAGGVPGAAEAGRGVGRSRCRRNVPLCDHTVDDGRVAAALVAATRRSRATVSETQRRPEAAACGDGVDGGVRGSRVSSNCSRRRDLLGRIGFARGRRTAGRAVAAACTAKRESRRARGWTKGAW